MAKTTTSSSSKESQFIRTQANLDKKGKTNKKIGKNPNALKFITPIGQALKDKFKSFTKSRGGK